MRARRPRSQCAYRPGLSQHPHQLANRSLIAFQRLAVELRPLAIQVVLPHLQYLVAGDPSLELQVQTINNIAVQDIAAGLAQWRTYSEAVAKQRNVLPTPPLLFQIAYFTRGFRPCSGRMLRA